jgi:hypothetical protein
MCHAAIDSDFNQSSADVWGEKVKEEVRDFPVENESSKTYLTVLRLMYSEQEREYTQRLTCQKMLLILSTTFRTQKHGLHVSQVCTLFLHRKCSPASLRRSGNTAVGG